MSAPDPSPSGQLADSDVLDDSLVEEAGSPSGWVRSRRGTVGSRRGTGVPSGSRHDPSSRGDHEDSQASDETQAADELDQDVRGADSLSEEERLGCGTVHFSQEEDEQDESALFDGQESSEDSDAISDLDDDHSQQVSSSANEDDRDEDVAEMKFAVDERWNLSRRDWILEDFRLTPRGRPASCRELRQIFLWARELSYGNNAGKLVGAEGQRVPRKHMGRPGGELDP